MAQRVGPGARIEGPTRMPGGKYLVTFQNPDMPESEGRVFHTFPKAFEYAEQLRRRAQGRGGSTRV